MSVTDIMDGDNYIFQYANRDGQTGLELDVFCRHYSRITPAYGCRLMNAVLAALVDAEAHAPAENAAAVKIQSTFRMFLQRKAFVALLRNACQIQRVFRGYATRKRLVVERTTVRQVAYLQTVFDMFATKIQACYRGYQSRKTKANYYAQQAYLQVVAARSSEVLAQARIARLEHDTYRNEEAQRAYEESYVHRTARMHHMVSTSSIPSVYQRFEAPYWATQPSHNTVSINTEAHNRFGDDDVVYLVPPVMLPTESPKSEELTMAQVGVSISGQKLEEDIRHNARAARREHATLKVTTRHRPAASNVFKAASSESPGQPSAARKETVRLNVSTTNPASGTRLPPLKPSRLVQEVLQSSSCAQEAKAVVPWELSTTHPPKRQLTNQASSSTGPSLSVTAPSAKVHCTARANRRPRETPHDAENKSCPSTVVSGGAAAGSASCADSVNPSMPSAAVSSFHRRFGVKRHDCTEHHLSCTNGISSDGADPHTFSGCISSAKEDAAVERSVNQKVVQALHGDSIFKVPAGRGRR